MNDEVAKALADLYGGAQEAQMKALVFKAVLAALVKTHPDPAGLVAALSGQTTLISGMMGPEVAAEFRDEMGLFIELAGG